MKQPNIIFILIDDMGWKDLSCYGSEFYETPNIDRLAQQGMRFTDAYAACPVCSPTRASIMSGKYPARVGVTDWIDHGNRHPLRGRLVDAPYIKYLPLTEKSLASALKEGGYQTWHVGKWHLGQRAFYPDKHGFDINIGGCSWGHPKKGYFSPYQIETLEEGSNGEYLTDRLTQEAIRLIQNRKDKPFFLNLWHYAVHTPIEVPEEETLKYVKKREKMGLNQGQEFEVGEAFPFESGERRHITRRLVQSNPAYAAMIENLDKNVGKLLNVLKEEGLEENTLIIFTSDNGGLATIQNAPTCNSPLSEGKGWMYEGGVREPLIVKWLGIVPPGSVCQVPVISPDFYPTLLEAADLPLLPEQHVDGISILPLLRGEKSICRDAIFWHYPHYGDQGGTPGAAVRMGEYKLIYFFETGKSELYNVVKDISEKFDLSEQMPELVLKMNGLLHRWLQETEAKMPCRNPNAPL